MSSEAAREFKEKIKSEQETMSREEIMDLMKKNTEFQIDLDNLIPQQHFWIDRGQVMSCEGATHPNHRAFKRM
jgi:hypothetical protein